MTPAPNPQDDGGPAFPIPIAGCTDGGVYNALEQSAGQLGGMSLRDYFAAKAMQGMINSQSYEDGDWEQSEIAKQAYDMASAMLRARQESSHGS
ncbi:hypothetical protein [Bordetella genomosp. 7]|uniref:Uncharacterized protein n=1 Tax=Bordetella genomosp. 7 TaxID=1416805 RepID=A0A261QZZ0_9BORD|nr:hypothetical protein [Bordetella genomosp. 7]OZI17962.1 hypothetical protein CAL19_12850 [Bordetella genomosp. 7]